MTTSIHLLNFLFYRRNNLSTFIFSSQSCLSNHQSFMPLPSRFFFFLLKTNKPGLCELFCCFWGCKQKNWFKAPAETSPSWAGWKNLCTLLAYKSQLVFITAVQAWWLVSAQGPSSAPAPFCRAISHTASGLSVLLTKSTTFFLSFTKLPLISPRWLFKVAKVLNLNPILQQVQCSSYICIICKCNEVSQQKYPHCAPLLGRTHRNWPLRTVCLWCCALQQPMPGISPGRNPRATTQCTGWGWWGYHANMFCLQWAAAFCHNTITKIIQISCRAAIQPSMREHEGENIQIKKCKSLSKTKWKGAFAWWWASRRTSGGASCQKTGRVPVQDPYPWSFLPPLTSKHHSCSKKQSLLNPCKTSHTRYFLPKILRLCYNGR